MLQSGTEKGFSGNLCIVRVESGQAVSALCPFCVHSVGRKKLADLNAEEMS